MKPQPQARPLKALSSIIVLVVAMTACGGMREPARDAPLVEAGRDLALKQCARCHGVGRLDESPLEQAPPFRRLHERYPVEHLAEAFAEGIVVGHTEMPAFELQPQEIEALVAYLKSLERGARRD